MFKLKGNHNSNVNKAYSAAGPYLGIGYFFISAMALFGFIGWQIDRYFSLNSYALLSGLLLGLALSFYNLFIVLKQIDKAKKDEK